MRPAGEDIDCIIKLHLCNLKKLNEIINLHFKILAYCDILNGYFSESLGDLKWDNWIYIFFVDNCPKIGVMCVWPIINWNTVYVFASTLQMFNLLADVSFLTAL